eukprot:759551_1
MMDYSEFESVDSDIDLIHPFWNILSNKLSKITDLTDTYKHNELNLDEKWWTNKFGVSFKSKYRTTKEEVLDELHFLSMKYKTMQEILYQSNPLSLNPIIAYNDYDWMYTNLSLHITKVSSEKLCQIDECEENESDACEWCIVDSDCLYGSTEPNIDENIFA